MRRPPSGIAGALALAAHNVGQWLLEHWHIEHLREDVSTSAENESSVVLYGVFEGEGVLLTGDAGVQALHQSAGYAEINGLDLPNRLKFMQIPHHGSRHNVSSSSLDRLIGPRILLPGAPTDKFAFASAGKDSQSHPRQMVLNAFLRRGFQTYATRGRTLCHGRQMPLRQGWGAAAPIAFSERVEAWD